MSPLTISVIDHFEIYPVRITHLHPDVTERSASSQTSWATSAFVNFSVRKTLTTGKILRSPETGRIGNIMFLGKERSFGVDFECLMDSKFSVGHFANMFCSMDLPCHGMEVLLSLQAMIWAKMIKGRNPYCFEFFVALDVGCMKNACALAIPDLQTQARFLGLVGDDEEYCNPDQVETFDIDILDCEE